MPINYHHLSHEITVTTSIKGITVRMCCTTEALFVSGKRSGIIGISSLGAHREIAFQQLKLQRKQQDICDQQYLTQKQKRHKTQRNVREAVFWITCTHIKPLGVGGRTPQFIRALYVYTVLSLRGYLHISHKC